MLIMLGSWRRGLRSYLLCGGWSWFARAVNWLLPIVFIGTSARALLPMLAAPDVIGFDAKLYSLAARAMIEGGDPWRVSINGAAYAGPPTTLVPFIPFAYLPSAIVGPVWVSVNAVLAALILRRLEMPAWWLAFPPLWGGILIGSVEVLMASLLILGGRSSGLSILLKPYAALPLLAERRWREIACAVVVGLVTLLLLPWGRFVADMPLIREGLELQSRQAGASTLALAAVGAVALAAFGLRRALWLATPVLWPAAQPHYAVMTLPALPRIVALIWAVPFPGAFVAGVVMGALALTIEERWRAHGPRLRPLAPRATTPSSAHGPPPCANRPGLRRK